MKRQVWMAACLLIGAHTIASGKKKDAVKEPTPLDQYVEGAFRNNTAPEMAHSPGSIWSPNARFTSLGTDLKASHVDDLVTIVVNERATAVATGDVKTSRASSVQAAVTSAAGIKSATGALANLAKADTATSLQGQGATSRGATLSATVSARVVNVLPNGYLVVEGTKHVQVNSENQIITVRGVVRPYDLDPTNSVSSDRLAQMDVQVNGKGVIGDSIHRPFFLYRLLLGLLPF